MPNLEVHFIKTWKSFGKLFVERLTFLSTDLQVHLHTNRVMLWPCWKYGTVKSRMSKYQVLSLNICLWNSAITVLSQLYIIFNFITPILVFICHTWPPVPDAFWARSRDPKNRETYNQERDWSFNTYLFVQLLLLCSWLIFSFTYSVRSYRTRDRSRPSSPGILVSWECIIRTLQRRPTPHGLVSALMLYK